MEKTYIVVNETGEPVYLTKDEIAAVTFPVVFPGTYVATPDEYEKLKYILEDEKEKP